MATCNGCGGLVGRDCFNPVECEWISRQQELHYLQQQAIESVDLEAVQWAYGKCVALGLENGSIESAMMMDRLKMMLGGYGG